MVVAREYRPVRLETGLLQELKSLAAASGRTDDEIIEEALRSYLEARNVALARDGLRSLLGEPVSRVSDQESEEEVARLAYDELCAMRRERREVCL